MPATFGFIKKINSTNLFYFLWSAVFILLLYCGLNSEGTYDTGDGITHYIISRFSFKHPELFYDLWGKPLFTILSAPFSQFGLKGITCFNILCGMLSALCAFKIAKLMDLKYPFMVIFFSIFAPIYFGVINSGLTEPLFSLLLVFSILKAFQGKHISAALIFSLAPFVRPEANFLIPVFAFYFLMYKQFKAIPFLLAGTILFSLIGWIHFGDILWLKHNSPYSPENGSKYGEVHGAFFDYIGNYEHLIGITQTCLFIAGCLFILIFPFLKKQKLNSGNNVGMNFHFFKEEFFLVYGCLFACIFVHTIVWWKGIFPTLGLWRYMSNVIPLAAILSLRGLNSLAFFVNSIWIKNTAVIVITGLLVIVPFREYYYPFTLDGEQIVVKESADWIKRSPYKDAYMYPMHPYATLALNLDPYDVNTYGRPQDLRNYDPGRNVPSHSLIIWDAHYGPNDFYMPLDSLMKCADYKLLKKFEPKDPFKVFGDTPFEVCIFLRN